MFIYNYLNLNSSLVVTTTVTFILVIINCWQNLKQWRNFTEVTKLSQVFGQKFFKNFPLRYSS